ncbi:MAG TPA: ABC transporter ATP-binding protein [Ruminococcaceae bacterium]|jgi:ATP-binding cassette subfamily B protein|nr:ABC transporter ATP-binding protein [Oscillospiraceae bacterium]HCB91397.1 ABC transporter ATP-binding protein [Oscillospiraceae bacterium]
MGYEEEEYTASFSLKIWKGLFPYLKPYRRMLLAIFLLNLGCAAMDILLPQFQQYAINHFIQSGTTGGLALFAGVYGAVVVLQTLFVMGFTRRCIRVEMNLGRDLKRACFVHLQTLSLSYYNTTPVGYILSRVMNDTDRIAQIVAWNLCDMLWAAAYLVGVFAAMLAMNARLALAVILVVPALALATFYFQSRILLWNRRVRRNNSRITGAYNEGIMGAKTSKTLVTEDENSRGFRKISEETRIASVRAARMNALYIPLVLFLGSAATAAVLVRGGGMVLRHTLLIGTLSAFASYAVGILEPVQELARSFSLVVAVQTNIERVTGLLEKKPGVVDRPEVAEKYGDAFHPKRQNWEPLRGDIEFRDISFRYPDGKENVLEHFSLKIPAGTTVAIVGETGAGKSTLVNLVCRFFEPTAGRILIDGRDYRERSQLWLHSNIGYVLQSPHLFSGTVRENIRYGRLDADDEEVERAAAAVGADRVAARLENGYDTCVGEGGDLLSTGEKQLISFARAVLADPRIFILDEATSSIDTQTEQLIQAATARLLKGRTSFLIAHRLSTIRRADLILVVRDGRIVERGTHAQLLRERGYYRELYLRQFEEETAAGALNAGT